MKKVLSVFSLVMINIIAVDSLRSLPFSAEYGLSLIFYYLLAAIVFFLPVALVSAELATAFPTKGGIYVWIREAFGEFWGFFMLYKKNNNKCNFDKISVQLTCRRRAFCLLL